MSLNYAIVAVRPAGGAWSSVNDMLHYVRMELDKGKLPDGKTFVSETALMARRAPQVMIGEDHTYGMGLMVNKRWGVPVVHHGGDLSGYHSDMFWIPDAQVGGVILTNGDTGGMLRGPFVRRLLEVLYDGESEAEEDITTGVKRYKEAIAVERKRLVVPPEESVVGKLAARYKAEGHRVLLAAGDTFRAAAIDQLRVWADRAGVEIVAHKPDADPGAVVYDALDAAIARGANLVIADTAGRLHTKTNLMEELSKIRRIIDKRVPGAEPETIFVIDATTGQNGLAQAKAFNESVGLTGIVLTKLDSTAKGGIVFAIEHDLQVPVRFVGVGEKIDDLLPFDPETFVNALFGED